MQLQPAWYCLQAHSREKSEKSMLAKKPEIIILCNRASQILKREICAGIEEEGLLYQVRESSVSDDAAALAREAATDSILETGIGICLEEAVLTFEKLPAEKPLFTVRQTDQETGREIARLLGKNAARLVKKQPFVYPQTTAKV